MWPAPQATSNPREVVQGDVRRWSHEGWTVCVTIEVVAPDYEALGSDFAFTQLVSRPGVTL